MTEARFQAICTTRYIIRKLLPFSHVECPEFRATVHAAWKVIKAETQRNLVAEMYLLMVAGIKKKLAAVIATALLPPFWINADLSIFYFMRARAIWPFQRGCSCWLFIKKMHFKIGIEIFRNFPTPPSFPNLGVTRS
jgi:hypothetical protein